MNRWLKAGYCYWKEGAGLPSWALPERSLDLVADELGDSAILRLSRPLQLAGSIEAVYDRMPEPSVFSAEAWQQAVRQWPPLSRVKAVVEAYLEVAGGITVQLQRLRDRIDAAVICRSLSVLLMAPFVPQGRHVIEEVADILGGGVDQPSQLIRGYAGAVMDGDLSTVEKIAQCLARHRAWAEWAEGLRRQMTSMKSRPRLVAVTPPLSCELASVLTLMMKEEEQQDEPGRGHPEHPGSEVRAQ